MRRTGPLQLFFIIQFVASNRIRPFEQARLIPLIWSIGHIDRFQRIHLFTKIFAKVLLFKHVYHFSRKPDENEFPRLSISNFSNRISRSQQFDSMDFKNFWFFFFNRTQFSKFLAKLSFTIDNIASLRTYTQKNFLSIALLNRTEYFREMDVFITVGSSLTVCIFKKIEFYHHTEMNLF